MEFVTVECMNLNPHDAHSWREGFLWYRKRECGGVPLDFYLKRITKHKHNFKVMTPVHDHTSGISFVCFKPGCKVQVSLYRHDVKEVLMYEKPVGNCYMKYKETW